MSGRISDRVGVWRRRYDLISVMEAIMHKLKSSILAVSAPVLSQRPLFVLNIVFLWLNKAVALHRCSNWARFSTLGLKRNTHTHTHTERHTCCFCSGARLPGASSRAVLRDSRDPLHTLPPPPPPHCLTFTKHKSENVPHFPLIIRT